MQSQFTSARRTPKSRPGQDNPSARLTESQVIDIKTCLAARSATHADLAARYGISKSLIAKISYGYLWASVGPERCVPEQPKPEPFIGPPAPPLPCVCGCGKIAKAGKAYIWGHNRRWLPHDPKAPGPPCPKCGQPKRAFRRGKDRIGQYIWTCPECNLGLFQTWAVRFPQRDKLVKTAHWKVHAAIKRGDLIRPLACEECGESGMRIEAAHSDYNHPLDVRWLCKPCHMQWDREEPKTLHHPR